MSDKITGTIKSEQGFYIGDLCYALNDTVYDEVWGGAAYMDGVYEAPNGHRFAVAGTAWGDGTYEDGKLREYDVDAGNLSLVPAELAERTDGGHYFPGAGTATFEADHGFFTIKLPSGEVVSIDTDNIWDDGEDDYYEEEDDWAEEDEEEDDYAE